MGETGCGKTRLIRYMCSLAVQKLNFTCIDDDDGDGDGSGDSTKNPKNMFIMKVLSNNYNNNNYNDYNYCIDRFMVVLLKKI